MFEYVPYNWEVRDKYVEFPHPFCDERDEEDGEPPRTLPELRMCAMSATLRSKPEWWRKYTDADIRARWTKEAVSQGLTQKQIGYVLDELAGYAALRDEQTGVEVSCFDKIWQSDTLIPADLQEALKDAVKVLEDVPDNKKDWHPRADGLVLDLVHPSLYPLIYGHTLGKFDGDGALTVAEAPDANGSTVKSESFAWLPTNFLVGSSGAKVLAYINNIHPSNTKLVGAVEAILGAFVPLFDRVLTDLLPENDFPLRIPGYYSRSEEGRPEDEDTEDGDQRFEEWYENRPIIIPDPGVYSGEVVKRAKTYSLKGREIQVIVKLANIILTPEKPQYPGGSWHVEGMQNERIIASGIYYYDEENIGESRLAFRAGVSAPEGYEQSDYSGAEAVWGLANEEALVQELGSVQTKAGRCIAFPNLYQHRVAPFSLVDRTRPGHRKILALFLVDPSKRIPSTSNVAPQQKQLLLETLESCGGLMAKLPRDLLLMIVEEDTHTMTWAEALKYREQLMDERTQFVGTSNESGYFAATFNMCEH